MKTSTSVVLLLCFALVGSIAYYFLYLGDYAKESKAQNEKIEKERINNKHIALERYDMIPACEDTQEYKIHKLSWKGYQGQQYEGELRVKPADVCKGDEYIENIERKHKKEARKAWDMYIREGSAYGQKPTLNETKLSGVIFQNTVRGQMPYMKDVIQSIESWKKKYNPPTRRAFAEMIVSFVQYRPYVFVHTNSCEEEVSFKPAVPLLSDSIVDERVTGQGFFYRYHINLGKKLCLPHHHKFTPIEFAYYLLGDCGIRSTFLYAVLSHFGYDVVIIASPTQNHALLAIHLEDASLSGDYIEYNNKKYYFWETTAPFPIGYYPKSTLGFFVAALPWKEIQ